MRKEHLLIMHEKLLMEHEQLLIVNEQLLMEHDQLLVRDGEEGTPSNYA